MRKWLIRSFMQAMLRAMAFFARRPRLEGVSNVLSRALARLAVRRRALGRAKQAADLGPLWQRAFPSPKQVPIVAVAQGTVLAEIHTPCPLRGSGDVQACHRMMEFDREVLRLVGGQFVVLQSQASPGVGVCRVAMRLQGQSVADLVPAQAPAAVNNAIK